MGPYLAQLVPVVIPHHGAKCISKLQITKAEIRWVLVSALGGQNDLAGVVVRVYCPDLGGVCFVEVSSSTAFVRLLGGCPLLGGSVMGGSTV